MLKFLLIFAISVSFSNCVSLAPYERLYVNDDEMEIGFSSLNNLNNNAKTYREGAQGGNSGKSGGGCGCN